MTTGIVSLIAAASAFIIGNIIKAIINLYKKRNNKGSKASRNLIASGGMPSVHTASIVAATVAIGFGDGFNSSIFALALVFAIIVAYDATHVRRAVGEQGKALRKILTKGVKKPYSSVGHSLVEVFVGCVIGVSVGVITSLLLV